MSIKYNLLAFLNVFSGFLFTLSLMKYFGANENVDNYFTAILVFMNFNVIVGFIYTSFLQHYLRLKHIDYIKAIKYYQNVIILTFFMAVIILIVYQILYYFINNNFIFNDFTSKYMYLILLYGIFEINNFIINAEENYTLPYIYLIVINLINFFAIIFFHKMGVDIIIYSTIFSYPIILISQFIYIYKTINLQKDFFIDKSFLFKTIKDSVTIKISSVINGSTDIVIAYIFTSLGDGFYSIYSYARKFALAIFNISNGPFVKKLNTEIAPLVLKKEYKSIIQNSKKTIYRIMPIFLMGAVITYNLLEFILPLITNNFTIDNINMMKMVFIYLTVFYFLLTIEYVFMAIISQFHVFVYGLYINIFYSLVFALSAYLFYSLHYNYSIILILLIISLSINISLELFIIKTKLFKDTL